MNKGIIINQKDNVAVALQDIEKGEKVFDIIAKERIIQGHKIALTDISINENIIKYGFPIGSSTQEIQAGQWVHTHNVKTNLNENSDYNYNPTINELPKSETLTFNGYKRKDGKVGIRNEIWVIPTVGCVNGMAAKLCRDNSDLINGSLEGIYAYTHPFGCSQMGDDHAQTKKLLAALAKHQNAAAVLVICLGCENLTKEQFVAELGEYDENRIKFLVCQDVEDEFEQGTKILYELAEFAKQFKREEVGVDNLLIGTKCGGSDGLSGITANPLVGVFSDMLIAQGGSTVLTEVPEMFGAEEILMNRCKNKEVFDKLSNMITDFKNYYTSHNQVVYENPSPGNKEGGITTLEDKSCGCVQKGGIAPVVDVVNYADIITSKGLNIMSGPGNDLVSATALTASGAHMVLFTTGRGTPFGAPSPTVKISTNTALYEKKKNWIDFNAGTIAESENMEDCASRLFDFVIEIANGKKAKNEENGFREISIFKDGVVL